MRWIRTVVRELFGLFVDDGSFAVAIIVWIGALRLLSLSVLRDTAWSGTLLFAGLGLILLASTIRRSHK
ncbi:MAG: hypothetical protein ACTHP8_13900 [Bosea sp. (in: a-proteobacteria)]|uniref:hypothetical protein n=1 Tax=Bosea sp. (in: a-proteobacteria) TaxID=1871050 RepID=UPI003F7C2AF0